MGFISHLHHTCPWPLRLDCRLLMGRTPAAYTFLPDGPERDLRECTAAVQTSLSLLSFPQSRGGVESTQSFLLTRSNCTTCHVKMTRWCIRGWHVLFLCIFTIWHTEGFIYMFFVWLLLSEHKLHEGRDFGLLWSLFNPQPLSYTGWCIVGTQQHCWMD